MLPVPGGDCIRQIEKWSHHWLCKRCGLCHANIFTSWGRRWQIIWVCAD